MDKIFLLINKFAKENLVTLKVDFCWFYVRIEMLRDNYKQCILIKNKELEKSNAEVVIITALGNMLSEIDKNY